jgi:hypothetical protein
MTEKGKSIQMNDGLNQFINYFEFNFVLSQKF